MQKRLILFIVMTAFLFFMAACNSNNDGNYAGNNSDGNSEDIGMNNNNDAVNMDQTSEEANSESDQGESEKAADNAGQSSAEPESERMVIYTADMVITINDFQQVQKDVQSLIEKADGYIVNSSVSSREDSDQQGRITARIPQEAFNDFLNQIEDLADEVKERNVSGEDVTKDYIDLDSRLKAKKEVKERLETLLEEAKNADDLLDISNKLGETQGEMEQIKGEMEYLENHTAMSTVHIMMTEENINDIGVKKWKDLNTWQKTKKVLVVSTNAIITFFSTVVIFLVGSSPILVPVILIAVVSYWIYRRRRRE